MFACLSCWLAGWPLDCLLACLLFWRFGGLPPLVRSLFKLMVVSAMMLAGCHVSNMKKNSGSPFILLTAKLQLNDLTVLRVVEDYVFRRTDDSDDEGDGSDHSEKSLKVATGAI